MSNPIDPRKFFAHKPANRNSDSAIKGTGVLVRITGYDMQKTIRGCSEGVAKGVILSGKMAGTDVVFGVADGGPKGNASMTPSNLKNKNHMGYSAPQSDTHPGAIVYLENYVSTNKTENEITLKAKWVKRAMAGMENDRELLIGDLVGFNRKLSGGEPSIISKGEYAGTPRFVMRRIPLDEAVEVQSAQEIRDTLTKIFETGGDDAAKKAVISFCAEFEDQHYRVDKIYSRNYSDGKFGPVDASIERILTRIKADANVDPEEFPGWEDMSLNDAVDTIIQNSRVAVIPLYEHDCLPSLCAEITNRIKNPDFDYDILFEDKGDTSDRTRYTRAAIVLRTSETLDEDGTEVTKNFAGNARGVTKVLPTSAPIPLESAPTVIDPEAESRHWNRLNEERNKMSEPGGPDSAASGPAGAAKETSDPAPKPPAAETPAAEAPAAETKKPEPAPAAEPAPEPAQEKTPEPAKDQEKKPAAITPAANAPADDVPIDDARTHVDALFEGM